MQHTPSQARCRKLRPMVVIRMNSWLRLSIALCAIVFAHSGLGQNYQGRELVKATLLADTSAVVPGKPFTAGLLLRMAPGWHTYWKFSGDAGLPTEIKWNLPPGWKVGEIQWPIPLKTNDPGDIQTYGYQDEILLLQKIIPPAKIDISPVKLSAEANWLVCEKICIPGSANLQLELPTSATADPKNTDLFARYRRLVPQNFPDPKTATATWSRVNSELRLKIVNEKGLHARASAKFVGVVEKFKDSAAIKVTRGDETVSGDSIMGLMMLGAGIGTSITVTATGPQAEQAIAALDQLVSSRFGEDE